jgi:hypothetical protein
VEKQEEKPAIDKAERQALLDEFERHFEVRLDWFKTHQVPTYRQDVTKHSFFSLEGKLIDDKFRLEARRWLEGRGWQFSRQMVPVLPGDAHRVEYVYLAPMIPVALEVGYHVTMKDSVGSIIELGLLPSTPERQTTEKRWDCDGNIFLCKKLGTPADAGVPGSESAHWWRDELAHKSRFSNLNWVILRVDVGRLEGARIYRDIWSKSGIIVSGVDSIPSDLIHLEYEG